MSDFADGLIDLTSRNITVKTTYRFLDHCRSIQGGKWDSDDKHWRFPRDPLLGKQIDRVFPFDVKRSTAFNEWMEELTAPEQEVNLSLDAPIPVTKTEPWAHQRRAYWFVSTLWGGESHPKAGGAMLFLAMGTGKSKIVVDLIQNFRLKRVLILCPKKVVDVWPAQFKQHSVKNPTVAALKDGSNLLRTKRAQQVMRTVRGNACAVVVINYDSARNDPFREWSLNQTWDLIVYDESHKIKAAGGATSRYCATVSRRATFRLALTGTPLPHSPLDIYGQFRAIDSSIFGTSDARFKAHYAIVGGFENRMVIGYKNKEEYNRRFYSRAIKVEKDVLDLPPFQHIRPPDIAYAELGTQARNHYSELENDFITELDSGVVNASNALVQLLRLHEIAGGWLAGEKIDTGKEELLEELLEGIDENEQVVVFALFRKELQVIHEVSARLERHSLELSGTRDELRQWQDGVAPILAVQIQAGGMGIDLTMARYCIYYSKGFSLGDYEQSLARVHRPGQKHPVSYYHLLTKGTVDSKIERALIARKQVVTAILADGGAGLRSDDDGP